MRVHLRRSLCALLTGALLSWLAGCKDRSPRPPTAEPVPSAAGALAALSGASEALEPALPPFVAGDAERGKRLVAQYECNRCHEGTGLGAPTLEKDCVRCHEQIASGRFKAPPEKLAKWKPHILAYRDVPSLSAMGERLRPGWVAEYLLNPRELRPGLAQTMPRLALSAEQARDIATYLAASKAGNPPQPAPEVRPDPSQIARGKRLMQQRACASCHAFTGAGFAAPVNTEPPSRTLGLAPDLKFARQRSEPAAIARWLVDPAAVKADAAMPNLALRPEEASDLAAFLAFGELEPVPPLVAPPRLPVLARRVGFDEVNQQVFAVTCRHCHTNPDLAEGDGGPGNTGGFGFAGRKIDFSSYAGIQSGAIDEQGRRVSLFAPSSDGLPRLVAALVARVRERTEQVSGEVRGMPLGLPPLSPEQIQLVESWVEQGRPL